MFIIEAFLRAKRMIREDELLIDADLGLEINDDNRVDFEILVAEEDNQATLHDLLDPAPVEQIIESKKVIDLTKYKIRKNLIENVVQINSNDNGDYA